MKPNILFVHIQNTLMNQERVPLLSAEAQYSPVVQTVNSSVVLPEMNGFLVFSTLLSVESPNQNNGATTRSENQTPNQVSSNHAAESTNVEERPKPKTAIEGYLAKCGGCQVELGMRLFI